MAKLTVALGVLLVIFLTETSCQRFIQPTFRPDINKPRIILPTYRPPVSRGPIIRNVREVDGDYYNENPTLPTYIDDIRLDPNRRYARSVDSPSARRGGGSHTTSSGSRDTGRTHPGYNRRNAREIRLPTPSDILHPSPTFPKPVNPFNPKPFSTPRQPYPIYARTARDVHVSGLPKLPTHRDVIIPNWNPNVKTQPWQRISPRKTRSVEMFDSEEDLHHISDDIETIDEE